MGKMSIKEKLAANFVILGFFLALYVVLFSVCAFVLPFELYLMLCTVIVVICMFALIVNVELLSLSNKLNEIKEDIVELFEV